MELYPAIDIHQGRVVRASRRDLGRATLYHPDPAAAAERFVAAGARWIHVVDLDRAFGVGDQTPLVAALVKRLPVPVQVGGGLWTADAVAEMRDVGVQRVLLGTQAVADAGALAELVDQFATESLGLSLDLDQGRVWARHWDGAAAVSPGEVAARARAAGIELLVVTDLAREGALGGANVTDAAALGRSAGVDVVVSGGVNGLGDLVRIRDAGLAGAIVGRALFEGLIGIEEALACSSPS